MKPRSPLIQGYMLYGEMRSRNFLEETPPRVDQLELAMTVQNFSEYNKGKLSIFELTQKSVLKVNGDKYSLTSWEPLQGGSAL